MHTFKNSMWREIWKILQNFLESKLRPKQAQRSARLKFGSTRTQHAGLYEPDSNGFKSATPPPRSTAPVSARATPTRHGLPAAGAARHRRRAGGRGRHVLAVARRIPPAPPRVPRHVTPACHSGGTGSPALHRPAAEP